MCTNFLVHAYPGIRYRKFYFGRTDLISQHDRAMLCIFNRIVYKISKQLSQPDLVETEYSRFQPRYTTKRYPLAYLYTHRTDDLFQKLFQLYLYRLEFYRIGFNLC